MRQSIVSALAEGSVVVLNDDANACATAHSSDEAPFAHHPARRLPRWGRAVLLITVGFLAAAWASEAPASSEAQQARRLLFASSIAESAPPGRAANTSKWLAQGTPSDAEAVRQAFDQEHHRADMLERELESAKQDLESIKGRDQAAQEKSAAENSAAELRRSLLRERAERVDRDLSGVRRDGELRMLPPAKAGEEAKEPKQTAAENGAVELRKSLQQERERAEQLQQNLATAKRKLEMQTALTAKANDEASRLKQVADNGAAELKQSLRQEHERAEALVTELSTARAKVDAYEAQARKASEQAEELKKAAAENGAAELRTSLQQERERAEQLQQNLASAKRELDTQTALTAKANDEASRLKQAADNGAAELKQSLRQEHERAEALTTELSTARAKVDAYEAQARKATEQAEELKKAAAESSAVELRTSLQQERERAEQLQQNLASARKDVDTQTALVTEANDEVARLTKAAESGATELKRSQQEHEKAEGLAKELATARAKVDEYEAREHNVSRQLQDLKESVGTDAAELRKFAPLVAVVATAGPITVAPEADTTQPATANQIQPARAGGEAPAHLEDTAETAKLVARASVLLGQGDIGSARIVLERAAETGSAQANFVLAETYDPAILVKWGTFGTRGDTTKARELYARAEAGGNKEAKQRLDALQ